MFFARFSIQIFAPPGVESKIYFRSLPIVDDLQFEIVVLGWSYKSQTVGLVRPSHHPLDLWRNAGRRCGFPRYCTEIRPIRVPCSLLSASAAGSEERSPLPCLLHTGLRVPTSTNTIECGLAALLSRPQPHSPKRERPASYSKAETRLSLFCYADLVRPPSTTSLPLLFLLML